MLLSLQKLQISIWVVKNAEFMKMNKTPVLNVS
jgi:hypothetical protein